MRRKLQKAAKSTPSTTTPGKRKEKAELSRDDDEDIILDTDDVGANALKSARARFVSANVIAPFGPELVSSDYVIANARDEYYEGMVQDSYKEGAQPLKTIQVLMHAAGQIVASNAALAGYTTLPIAPSKSPAQGLLVLYNIYRLVQANTPAGATLANALWLHYRGALARYLGPSRLVSFQNEIRRFDGRLEIYPWVRAIRDSDAVHLRQLELERNPLSTLKPLDPTPNFVVFSDTDLWNDWLTDGSPANDASSRVVAYAPAATKDAQPQELKWKDRKALLMRPPAPVREGVTELYRILIDIASAEPLVLGPGLDAKSSAMLRVTGHEASARGEGVLERLLDAYSELAALAAGDDESKLRSYQLYIFLCVWLPLRTGIGFDRDLGVFRPRPITHNLVGRTGLLPLLASALYSSGVPADETSDTSVFLLAAELSSFVNRVVRKAGRFSLPEEGTARDFLRVLPVASVRKWAATNHPNVHRFHQAEMPLLDRLFAAAQYQASVGARVQTDTPWFEQIVRSKRWVDRPLQLPPDERTVADALALYQLCAHRVGAPDADTMEVRGGVNHAEFGAPGMANLIRALTRGGGYTQLGLFIGAALGRLPAMLAYLNPNLFCACVPTASLSLSSTSADVLARATDWITPIVDQMAEVSGDSSLRQRVFVMHEWPLAENHRRGRDIYNHALEHMPRPPEYSFIVANSINAVVQFDVPETLFARQVVEVHDQINPTDGLIITVPTGLTGERAIALAPAAMPLGPLLQYYHLSNTSVFYTGSLPFSHVPVLVPEVGIEKRRRALLQSVGVGGSDNMLYNDLYDAVSDAQAFLDAIQSRADMYVQFDQQLVRIAVLSHAIEVLRKQGVLRALPSENLVRAVFQLFGDANKILPVDKQEMLDLVKQRVGTATAPGQVKAETSLLGQLLIDLQADSGEDVLTLPKVVFTQDPDLKPSIDVVGARVTVVEALNRMRRAKMEAGGKPCIQVIGDWAQAMFALAAAAMDDFHANFYTYDAKRDQTASLNAAEKIASDLWPSVVACLKLLIQSGEEAVAVGNESLQMAYGPALLCAHMINTTLFGVQRMVEVFQTDLRAKQFLEFAHQEIPFLAWFGLKANAEQRTVARLADLLFNQRQWLLPVVVAAQHKQSASTLALRDHAALTARQVARLLLPEPDWQAYERALKERQGKIQVEASRRRAVDAHERLSAKEKMRMEEAEQEIRQELRQYDRVIDAFNELARMFRAQRDAENLPLNFFVDDSPEYSSDLQAREDELLPLVKLSVAAIEAEVTAIQSAPSAAEATSARYSLMLPRLESMFQQLAYSYVSGGYRALIDALSGTRLKTEVIADVQEEAMRTEDVWRVPINFTHTSPEIDDAFPDVPDASGGVVSFAETRRWLRDWLRDRSESTAGVRRAQPVVGRTDLVATFEDAEKQPDPDDKTVASDTEEDTKNRVLVQAYLVIIPRGTGAMLSLEQKSWLKTYMAAERRRVLTKAASDYADMQVHHRTAIDVVMNRLTINKDTVDRLRNYYKTAVGEARALKRATTGEDTTSLMALSVESDNYWLREALLEPWRKKGQDGVPQPRSLPRFVTKQLQGVTLENAILSNGFSSPDIMRMFLWTAYTNLADDKPKDDPEFRRWRKLLMTPVPTFGDIPKMSWAMSRKHLIAAIGPSDDDNQVPDLRVVVERVAENTVYRLLLLATLENLTDETKHEDIATRADPEAAIRFWRFAQKYVSENKAENAEAAAWWDKMLELRESALQVDPMDTYTPDDSQVIYQWSQQVLYAATPEKVRPLLVVTDVLKIDDGDDYEELDLLAVFVRMVAYSLKAGSQFQTKLVNELNLIMKEAGSTMTKLGLIRDGQPLPVPPLATIRASGELVRDLELYVSQRMNVASEQRAIWRGGLVRLLATLDSQSARDTVLWWVRSRASSWSQRVRMIEPATRDDAAWPEVLSGVIKHLPTATALEGLSDRRAIIDIVPNSALGLAIDKTEKRWRRYAALLKASAAAQPLPRPMAQAAAAVLATAIAAVDETVASQLAADFTRRTESLMGVASAAAGSAPLNLRPVILADPKKVEELEKTRMKEQSEDELRRREEMDRMSEPVLELFTARFQPPTSRFGSRVINDDQVAELATDLATGLGSPKTAELLAQLASSLSRHIQFVDAERNRAKMRPTIIAEAAVSNFTADILESSTEPERVYELVATRLLNDSLLYADLNSLSVPKKVVPKATPAPMEL